MSKPSITKFLLTRMTVDRDGQRKSLPANSTQILTQDEVDLLDRLTKQSGKLYYREPRNERAIVGEDDLSTDSVFVKQPERNDGLQNGVGAADADGNTTADLEAAAALDAELAEVRGMTVKQLKEFLGEEPAVEFSPSADKPVLLSLAEGKVRAANDPDGGL